MANGLPSFIKEEKSKLIFRPTDKGDEFVAYVPEKYFERKIAEINGEYIDIMGIFDFTVQDKNGKSKIGLHPFRFPTIFTTKPGRIEKKKDIILTKYTPVRDYRILRYEDGDEIASSTEVVQFIGNVEKFMNMWYVLGFINNTIPYDQLLEYMVDNMALNGNSYGLNAQMFGFTFSELCRSQKDPKVPFRLSSFTNMHEYQSMSVKNISKLTSPYTAIISEDFDESLVYAILNNTPKDSPLEKILVGK